MQKRGGKVESQQHRKGVQRHARTVAAVDFFNVLTGPQLLETTEALLPAHRERLYPPTMTLSMFLTGLTRHTGRLLSVQAQREWRWRWRGRLVKWVDGTGISMPDTLKNQACYLQLSSQAQGVGFPLARRVGVICLSTGVVMDAALGPHAGKGNSELGLQRKLSAAFSPGEVMLADALYCNYFLIVTLQAAGVDVLFEQNGSRTTDFRRGNSLWARAIMSCAGPSRSARPGWRPSSTRRLRMNSSYGRPRSTDKFWSPRCSITAPCERANYPSCTDVAGASNWTFPT